DLFIANNKIAYIPKEVARLKKLGRLFVSGNIFKSIPKPIFELDSLEWFAISDCQIEYLPPKIADLKNLISLNIGSNQISNLPHTIGQLKNLRELHVNNNRIKTLPRELESLTNLELLNLRNNPLPLPPEILQNHKEPSAVLSYYFSSIYNPNRPIGEVKLIVVGQGSVGKTSIVERLLHDTFDQNQSKTEGISINQWWVGDDEETELSSNIRLNIWDFGGQEIMHATH